MPSIRECLCPEHFDLLVLWAFNRRADIVLLILNTLPPSAALTDSKDDLTLFYDLCSSLDTMVIREAIRLRKGLPPPVFEPWSSFLYEAASNGYTDILDLFLVELNGFRSLRTDYLLHYACICGQVEIVERLLTTSDWGNVDVNLAALDTHAFWNGRRPLHLAAGHPTKAQRMVELLLSHGADPLLGSSSDSPQLPIHFAARSDNHTIVTMLLRDYGESQLLFGRSEVPRRDPLQVAVDNDCRATIKAIIRSPYVTDRTFAVGTKPTQSAYGFAGFYVTHQLEKHAQQA